MSLWSGFGASMSLLFARLPIFFLTAYVKGDDSMKGFIYLKEVWNLRKMTLGT